MKGSDISSPPCHPACPERSRRERSSPIFSSAPHLGVSGCVVEGPWQHLNLNQAPSASNQLERREACVPSSPLLRRPGLQPPAQTTPKTILPPIPFSALTHAPVISTGMNDSFRFSLRGRAERALCVPCASPRRRDLGNMSTPPHPSKPPLFFPEPTTLCPTLCADKNAPFHPRRPQRIYHPPETASLSCRSSPSPPNGISSRDSVPVPANLFH